MEEPSAKKTKRVREACEPCRRKKGRCPGERPVCSLCARLGQTCSYAADAHVPNTIQGIDTTNASYQFVAPEECVTLQDCVENLDDKITEVLDQVRLLASTQLRSQEPDRQQAVHTRSAASNIETAPSPHVLRRAAELYLQFCHCQPLPLFSPKNFTSRIATRDPEVRLCVAGLSLRFDPDQRPQLGQHADWQRYLASARLLVMDRVSEGTVEISTLQCLCMLALADFNDGRPQQAGIFMSVAIELSRSARLDIYARQATIDTMLEEHVRTLWSIVLLQYLMGNIGTASTTVDATTFGNPPIDAINDLASDNKQNGSYSQEGAHDLGVVMYGTHMKEVWYSVRRYVFHRGKLDKHPPWSGRSEYSSIMFRQMELESQMPHKHRFKPSGFADHNIAVLSANRHYWAPWLVLQIVYHAIVCTLNHPILLSIHLRRFRVNQIPELFLQQTADLITSHTDWVIHILEIAKEKEFQLADPFLGQWIAVVATIFLQQSYTENQDVRMEKQAKFSTCLRFVQDVGRCWPQVDQMAIDLQTFENAVSRAYQFSSYENEPNLSQHVDLTTFWKILDNTLISTPLGGAKSVFGPTLTMRKTSSNDTDFLSTRLLPEPTRVTSLPQTSTPTSTTAAGSNGAAILGERQLMQQEQPNIGFFQDGIADSPFLAQNFFALGQDFVGNVDDWFNWTDA